MIANFNLITVFLAATAAAIPTRYRAAPLAARAADVYRSYSGDGSEGAGWPGMGAWGSFDELWNSNEPLMRQSCGWNGWAADNSQEEINNIRSAIQQVAGETGVDNRFILSVMMQESKGCVRVPTTNNGVVNPGLMQSHNGSGSCAGQSVCPAETITQMIRDGVAGTQHGDGLQQTLQKTSGQAGGVNARAYYAAARMYNSGSVDYSNLGNGFYSVGCYSSDVANRLTGWTLAPSQCW